MDDIYYVEGTALSYHAALDAAQTLSTARLMELKGSVSRTMGNADIVACTVKVLRQDGTVAATVRP